MGVSSGISVARTCLECVVASVSLYVLYIFVVFVTYLSVCITLCFILHGTINKNLYQKTKGAGMLKFSFKLAYFLASSCKF